MRTLQEKYNAIQEGKFSKDQFLVEARQQLPNLVTRYNGYDDAVQILKNRGMIQEAKKQEGRKVTDHPFIVYTDKQGKHHTEEINYEDDQKAFFKTIPNTWDVYETRKEAAAEKQRRTKEGKKETVKEDYSRVLGLPDGKYFAKDENWDETYQGKNGLFFSIEGNDIYDKDGRPMQTSPREFLSQFKPDEIVQVKDADSTLDDPNDQGLGEVATDITGFPKWRELGQDEKDHISKFVKDSGDRDQAEYEKRREERLKAQDERLSAYIASQRNLKEAKQPKPTKKGLADYRYKPTNEMDKYPYEQILRGLRVELETLGVKDVPTAEEYTKALSKVSKNLEKDSIFYTNQVAGVNPKVDLHDKLVDATAKNTVDTFNGMKKAALKEGFKKLIKKMLSETVGDDPEKILDESDPLHDYMESKQQEDKVMDEAPAEKTITTKQLIAIANRAGNIVVDAKDNLMDLGAAYGDAIPMSRVREILRDYDLTAQDLKNETVKENLHPDLRGLYDDKERAERANDYGDYGPVNDFGDYYPEPDENNESSLEEGPAKNNPKIQKLVDGINQLISQAVDSDGDPIGVIEPGTTWEEPIVYSPIQYTNGALKITTNSGYRGESETYTVLARNMELDGIPTLRLIMRMYKKAVKKAGQPAYPDDEVKEGIHEMQGQKTEAEYKAELDAYLNKNQMPELKDKLYKILTDPNEETVGDKLWSFLEDYEKVEHYKNLMAIFRDYANKDYPEDEKDQEGDPGYKGYESPSDRAMNSDAWVQAQKDMMETKKSLSQLLK
jgi:hypothetical protein